MSGVPLPPEEQAAFDQVLGYIARLKSADKVVVSTGMWNFGMPYRRKHWVDLVLQAGHTFGLDPSRGYLRLVTGKPVALPTSTGGDFTQEPMAAADLLTPSLRAIFSFMGFTDIRGVTASCTAFPPEVSGPAIATALEAARVEGARF
jgi:FMN-dependent NADH-azoreductase